ncbi:MAG: NAD-dependent epimerase/dehydratase family protein [Thermoplasmata archaeon]
MEIENRRVLLTGGAGFIGSHLAEELLRLGNEVIVVDNFSSGKREFIGHLESNERFSLQKADILSDDIEPFLKDSDCVFHLAANPDVRLGEENTRVHLDQNIIATYRLLEEMRKTGKKEILFTSTSTVYGEASQIPTAEDYGPLIPISLYGASKLACEALISSYCYTFDFEACLFRFANVVGSRSTHGVIHDFVEKLRRDPSRLEILGRDPGTVKSYCHISDCVQALIHGWKVLSEPVEIFNIGSEDAIDVKRIADIVTEEMGLEDVAYRWTGGVDDGRGWKGDVREMLLSVEKLKSTGWRPRYSSEDAVRLATRELILGNEL